MDDVAKHRLNQKDLVMNILSLFSEEYENCESGSIWDISISLESIIDKLKEKCNVSYKSDNWVWTQLKRYEEEIGAKLFKRTKSGNEKKSIVISMHSPYINFFQKKHLYINEKIKVANGVYDKINNFAMRKYSSEPIRIFLGAGTLCFHISTIFADRSFESETKYIIHTNNLGVLSELISPRVNHENILVTMPEGDVDPVTYTIIGENNEYYAGHEFDFIIQGTSGIVDGKLYIESAVEKIRKKAILISARGYKILALTKHEFADERNKNTESYGFLSDYDSIIVPRKGNTQSQKKKHELKFEESESLLVPEILNWNYEIYKVNK